MQRNSTSDPFDELWQTLNPSVSTAKILIEVDDKITLKIALGILKNMGITVVDHQIPCESSPDWILLCLDVEDVRDVVMGFSEVGFSRVKGINRKKQASF